MSLAYSSVALVALVAGTIAAVFLNLPSWAWLLAGLLMLLLAIMAFIFNRRWIGLLSLLALVCWGGFGLSNLHQNYQARVIHNQYYQGQILSLSGVQIERPAEVRYGYRAVLRLNSGQQARPIGKVFVYSSKPFPESSYGRRLLVTGRFKGAAVPTEAWPESFEQQGTTGSINLTRPAVIVAGKGLPGYYQWAESIRRRMIGQGERSLKPANADFLHSMIFGVKLDDQPQNQRLLKELRFTGTIHLLSVSGLHIGFVVVSLNLLLGLLQVPKAWRLLPLGLGIGFYILMTGMEPPVLRAGVMLLLYFLAEGLGSKDSNLNRLSLAAFILLLVNPYNLFQIGFQLSVAATLGVVWLYPLLKEYFPVDRPWLGVIWNCLLLSIAAQLMVTPFLVYYFQQISWISPLVNLLIFIPAMGVVVGGLAGESLGCILPWLGLLVLTPLGWALNLCRIVVAWFGDQSWSVWYTPRWPWPWNLSFYLGIIFGLDLLRPNPLRRKPQLNYGWLLLGSLFIINLVIWVMVWDQTQRDFLQVSFIDVGQGDAILIQTPDGVNVLVDSGDDGQGRARVLPCLRSNRVKRLDLVIITHGHRDHLGGLDEVLMEVPSKAIYLPAALSTSETDREFLARLKKLKIARHYFHNGTLLRLGQGVRLEVLAAETAKQENDRSMVLLLEYGKNKLLLTGDLSFEGEAILLKRLPNRLRATVLKVGHHGSNYSTGMPFLTQVKPRLAVISVGEANRFSHPGSANLKRLNSLGVRVYRTDWQGGIYLRVYRNRLVATTEKGGL